MAGDREACPTLDRRRRGLDETAGNGRDGATPVAPNMFVVLPRSLEAGFAVSQVDAVHRTVVLQAPKGAEDRREVRGHTAIAESLPQLLDRPVMTCLLGKDLGQRGSDVAGARDDGDDNANSLRN
jgi:hypothetical protein